MIKKLLFIPDDIFIIYLSVLTLYAKLLMTILLRYFLYKNILKLISIILKQSPSLI